MAVDFMYGHEFLQLLSAAPEFSQNSAVQLHLVDLAVLAHIRGAGGIGAVQVLVLPGRDAHRPGSAHVDEYGLEVSIVIEYLQALVGAIADVYVALMIHLDGVHILELSGAVPSRSESLHKVSELVEFHHSLVIVSIGHENVSR